MTRRLLTALLPFLAALCVLSAAEPVLADAPQPLVRRQAWLAVAGTNSMEVIRILGIADPAPAGWKAGLKAANNKGSGTVFVSPPVKGWILVTGAVLPQPSDFSGTKALKMRLAAWSGEAGEVQYYVAHPVKEHFLWILASGGQVRRLVMQPSADLGIVAEEGIPDEAEMDRKLRSFTQRQPHPLDDDYRDAKPVRFPQEEDVLHLAGLWSVNPQRLGRMDLPASAGFTGRWTWFPPAEPDGKR